MIVPSPARPRCAAFLLRCACVLAWVLVALPGPLAASAGLPQGHGAPPPPPQGRDGAPPPGAPMPPPPHPYFPPPPPPPPPPPMPVTEAPVADAAPTRPALVPGSVADLEDKLAAARRSNDSHAITEALIAAARAQLQAGANTQALTRAEEAQNLAARYNNNRLGRDASLVMADAYAALGDPGMQETWTRHADHYRQRIERELAPLPEAAAAPPPTETVGVSAPAPATTTTIIVEKPAPARSLAWWLLVPVAGLLLWGWLRSSRKADALHEQAERLARHQKHLRHAHQTLQQQADHLRQTATQDALTGVLTRQAFAHASEELLHHAQHYGKPVALLLFDLDHFKAINDSHGHLAGDSALKLVVGIVRENLDSEDLFGRFGGDEFLIASIDHDAEGARALAENIRRAVRERAQAGDPALSALSLSLGVALAGKTEGHDLSALFARADAALYEAKRAGRDRVVLDDPARAVPGNSHFPMRSLSATPDA